MSRGALLSLAWLDLDVFLRFQGDSDPFPLNSFHF